MLVLEAPCPKCHLIYNNSFCIRRKEAVQLHVTSKNVFPGNVLSLVDKVIIMRAWVRDAVSQPAVIKQSK